MTILWANLEDDLNFVLTEGPWIIAGQYLTLQKWQPGFCPAAAHITQMTMWIRVSAIELECFDVWALERTGNLLGKLLKIDALTTSQKEINQTWYNVEYEGLPDRRKPKNGSKDLNGQSNGLKHQASWFDAMRKVVNDFGHDVVEGGGGVYLPRAQVGAHANSGLNEKVWTKSKNPKVGARLVLQDISNRRVA
ncbi:unnamed protein product [Prunus armeniaca]